MTTKFDPHQYALDAGWSAIEIEATGILGLADEDESRIRQIVRDSMLETGRDESSDPDDFDDAVLEAENALIDFCRRADRATL